MSIALKGVMGPVVTTFNAVSGDLDLSAFAFNVRAHLAAGLHGVLVAGSTGEAVLLDDAEVQRLLETARTVTPSDRLLIAGTGAESTRMAVARACAAAAAGADAVLVVSPHYYASAMSGDALLTHFRRVADESPVPVILYNIPKYVGFTIPPAIVMELAAHENIIGIKDSAGNQDLLTAYVHAQRQGFAVLNGSGSMVHGALAAGARGAILAVSLFAPQLALCVYESMMAGDEPAAMAAQARLSLISATIVGEMGVAGVKAALDGVGLRGGAVRAPLLPLTKQQLAQVRALVSPEALSVTA